MVLAGGQHRVGSVPGVHIHEHVQGEFHAHQWLFEHDGAAGIPELSGHEGPEGGQGLGLVLSQNHPFSGSEAIGLEHDGKAVRPAVDETLARAQIGHGVAGGAGDGMAEHELLGEGLAPLQVGRGGVMAENRNAQGPDGIRHARHQGHLRPGHHQPGAVRSTPGGHFGRALQIQHHTESQLGQGIAARSRDQIDGLSRSLELQGQGMFPATGAEEQDLHGDLHHLVLLSG